MENETLMPVSKIKICQFKIRPLLIAMIFFSVTFSTSLPLSAQAKGPLPSSCIAKLQNPSMKNIDCTLDIYLDKPTQQSIQGNTAGMIQNAACKTKISMAKKTIIAALINENVLQVPKQPVRCNINVIGDSVLAKFNMAPEIRFAGGKAVQAKPGMSDVLGLPDILAKLLIDWVNSSPVIENAMLDEVNKSLKMIPSLENNKAP